jgi:hypothetical protein
VAMWMERSLVMMGGWSEEGVEVWLSGAIALLLIDTSFRADNADRRMKRHGRCIVSAAASGSRIA